MDKKENIETAVKSEKNWAKQAIDKQRHFFNTGATRPYSFRVEQLKKLKHQIKKYHHEAAIALKKDIGRPQFEAYFEIAPLLYELNHTIKKLKSWMKPKKVRTSLLAQPGRSRIEYTPKGIVFLVGPYNYPFILCLQPLVGAIAAGNCVVVKPSSLTPEVSKLVTKIVGEVFPDEYINVFEGSTPVTNQLLEEKFDHIFFTGSPRVGRIIMAAAAKHLTPVTLELGGKSPAIIHSDADLKVAARRIVAGKFMNAGQTCVAPDYLFVHDSIKDEFLIELEKTVNHSFGHDPVKSPDFGRLINDRHFERVKQLIDPSKLVIGGQTDKSRKYIAPTILRDVDMEDAVMQEEIFGPVLPVMGYKNLGEIYELVDKMPRHPLALYLFTENPDIEKDVLSHIQFGGGCINNTILHVGNGYLPFGGAGESGIGSYHGYYSFEAFSHKRSILSSVTRFDPRFRYAPYRNKVKWMKKIADFL